MGGRRANFGLKPWSRFGGICVQGTSGQLRREIERHACFRKVGFEFPQKTVEKADDSKKTTRSETLVKMRVCVRERINSPLVSWYLPVQRAAAEVVRAQPPAPGARGSAYLPRHATCGAPRCRANFETRAERY